ncbi:WYL domain protein [Kutzneria sp. CA-103260]|nr:WYL domain protein [Kutzneria sp. CA-103260]
MSEVDDEPGWTRVELRFRAMLGVETLLAFGPGVEVLAPDDARQALARHAEATAAVYRRP